MNSSCRSYEAVPLPLHRSRTASEQPRLRELLIGAATLASGCHGGFSLFGQHCTAASLVPDTPLASALTGRISVLLIGSDAPTSSLLEQVERVLPRLHTASTRGLLPGVFFGQRPVVQSSCQPRIPDNRYYERTAGDNVWEYFFEPVSSYSPGAATVGGRAVRVFVDHREGGDLQSGSEGSEDGDVGEEGDLEDEQPGEETNEMLAAEDSASAHLRTLQAKVTREALAMARDHPGPSSQERIARARLVRRFLRVRRPILAAAARLLKPWREGSPTMLGIALGDVPHDAEHGDRLLTAAHEQVTAFLRAHASRATVLVVVASRREVVESFRARYSAQRVYIRDGSPEADCVTTAASDLNRCRGLAEILDALLLVRSGSHGSLQHAHAMLGTPAASPLSR